MAETAGIKIPLYPESKIKPDDLQIICGNSQAEAATMAMRDNLGANLQNAYKWRGNSVYPVKNVCTNSVTD
jgi:hypothetical protein